MIQSRAHGQRRQPISRAQEADDVAGQAEIDLDAADFFGANDDPAGGSRSVSAPGRIRVPSAPRADSRAIDNGFIERRRVNQADRIRALIG